VEFLHAIASCAFFLLPTKPLSSHCLSTAPCCVSSCVFLVSFTPSLFFSVFFFIQSASVLLLGLSPLLILLSHLLLLSLHSFSNSEDISLFFFSPPLRQLLKACVQKQAGFSGAEELQVAIFHGESEVYRRHPLSSTAAAGWFPHQRRYRKTFLYVFFKEEICYP
jgi:hypothetical protein